MKASIYKIENQVITLSVILILFWLFAAGSKLYDFNDFKGQIHNQVFSRTISDLLIYAVPAIEIIIAALLVYATTRLAGMVFSFLLMLAYTVYVGLAIWNVYSRMPCNCAGLLGQNSSWESNFKFNLFVTAVAVLGIILTIKDKERRRKGMDPQIVSHAPLTT